MAILVTGGAGYIGSVMVEVLRERGQPVLVLDDLSRGHREALEAEVPLLVGDLGDTEFLKSALFDREIDGVIHFAASSLVGESMQNPAEYFRNNVGGLVSLLSVLIPRGVTRFILSSSAAVYGDPGQVPIPESSPTVPTNPYGESKLTCERILRWFGTIHGLRWTSLRYFNAAGATELHGEDHWPETHLIPLALRAARSTEKALPVFGLDYPTPDGSCVRDYIHVEDLVGAHLLALEQIAAGSGGVYNLGNGQGFSVLEVISAVERVGGRKVPWEPAPRRAGDPARLIADSAKARRELGWKPRKESLDLIVESAWRWMEQRPNGYASLRP